MRLIATLAGVLTLISLVSQCSSQMVLMSDQFDVPQTCPAWSPVSQFEAWACVDFNAGPWGPLSVDTDQAFTFASSGPVEDVPSSLLAAGWAAWGPSLTDNDGRVHPALLGESDYSNGTIRAKVRVASETVAFIPFRVTVAGNYWFQASGADNEFRIVTSREQGGIPVDTRSVPVPDVEFTSDEDWWMEAAGVGEELSLKVWRDGEQEPSEPQLSIVDPDHRHGWFGVGAAAPAGLTQPLVYSATFDDISFRSVSHATCNPSSDLLGDLDGDGEVAFPDFLALAGNFGLDEVGYARGDVDCNGTVNFADFLALAANFGESLDTNAASVPEPSSFFLTSVLAACWSFRRNKRRAEKCGPMFKNAKTNKVMIHAWTQRTYRSTENLRAPAGVS